MEGDADFFKNNLYSMFSSSVQVKSGNFPTLCCLLRPCFRVIVGFVYERQWHKGTVYCYFGI